MNINLKGLRQSSAINESEHYFTLDLFTVQLEHVLETSMDSSICTCMEGGSYSEPPSTIQWAPIFPTSIYLET